MIAVYFTGSPTLVHDVALSASWSCHGSNLLWIDVPSPSSGFVQVWSRPEGSCRPSGFLAQVGFRASCWTRRTCRLKHTSLSSNHFFLTPCLNRAMRARCSLLAAVICAQVAHGESFISSRSRQPSADASKLCACAIVYAHLAEAQCLHGTLVKSQQGSWVQVLSSLPRHSRICRRCHTWAVGNERPVLHECSALSDLRAQISHSSQVAWVSWQGAYIERGPAPP